MLPLIAAIALASLTAPPAGFYRVEGNRLLDTRGRPYLIRGTKLAIVPSGRESESLSATVLITIPQRLDIECCSPASAV